ncbi:MAG: 3'-5' exonuclease [Treponema sp.]|nr:3'-5' exonuclease [Treponema sp.]MBQ6567428.1 3'-5' exonuclease [Treponema sp.]MBQ7168145.1 3'-5' exonuclease [Treponema sp.]
MQQNNEDECAGEIGGIKIEKARLFRAFRQMAALFEGGRVFVAFDTETTGLKAENDEVLEIGAVKFNKDGLLGESFNRLIKPVKPIPAFITAINHIDDEMVKDAPPAAEVARDFLDYIGRKSVLVAHNARFDVKFVNATLIRAGLPQMGNLTVDTLTLSRWAYPLLANEAEKGQYKLQSLAKRFGIEVLNAHRAEDDARVCMELFLRILKDTDSVQKRKESKGNIQ